MTRTIIRKGGTLPWNTTNRCSVNRVIQVLDPGGRRRVETHCGLPTMQPTTQGGYRRCQPTSAHDGKGNLQVQMRCDVCKASNCLSAGVEQSVMSWGPIVVFLLLP